MSLTQTQQLALLGILQRGITEARALALTGHAEQAAELLDALDGIPRHLARWRPESSREIERNLKAFRERYPDHATDYPSVWSGEVDLT